MDSSTDYRAGLQSGCGLRESHLPPGSPHRRIGGEFKQPTYVSQHSPFLYRVVITTFNAREWEKYQEPAREKEGGERLEADATRDADGGRSGQTRLVPNIRGRWRNRRGVSPT